jgi:D-sedoheptulose 7-phosphate isomerase
VNTDVRQHFSAGLRELATLAETVADQMGPALEQALAMVRETVRGGGTLFFCGNGGSAADAQHIATEYVVRYMRERRGYPAIALTTDTSLLTAAANDMGFEAVFARQVNALARPGDLLVIHSTSGNSPNVLRAVETAKKVGITTVGLTGGDGGKLGSMVEHHLRVSATKLSPRIQESHILIGHVICELVDCKLFGGDPGKTDAT